MYKMHNDRTAKMSMRFMLDLSSSLPEVNYFTPSFVVG